jgi:DNA polymerase III alpha subunit
MARRPEVKRYMEERYGADQVCSVGTYTTLQVKAAVKDLCRLKGVPVAEVNSFTSKIDGVKDFDDLFRIACQKKDVANFINRNPEIIEMVGLIQGQPKAKSIHACAMMIYPDEKDMYHWNPIRRQGDMLISEWEGGELDTAGFLKEDILGILQLSKFGDILKLIKDDTGEEINLYELPLDDPKVYSYFQRGWNGDVFHFGAKGLTGYCKMLKPDNITELVNCIGLYRPGVMEGNFHNEYILRKKGEREVSFRKGAGEILQSSRYIMIWQEQTMKMFQVLGGFNLVDADGARRAIGKKNVEKLQPFRERFLKNYIENFGVDQKYAEETWKEIENMADYQFNHCVSGKTVILRGGRANKYIPTVEEMYKIRNSYEYAKETGHLPLRGMYLRRGYGSGWSLNEAGKLIVNRIKDIRYVGKRSTYKVEVEGGMCISVTDNHKFITLRGELMLKDMIAGDMIPVNVGYQQEDTMYRFTDKGNSNTKYHDQSKKYREVYILNSRKGSEGFVSKENSTSFTRLQYYKDSLMKDYCECCGARGMKLEVHHIDGCHGNNNLENLETVCVSCHKKKHYEIGRTKMGRKGLEVEWRKITSIEFNEVEDVYDVEMADPYHTFTISNGIVTCNSHAVAYANTGYACQWLKVNYPLAFWSVAFSYADDDDFPVYLHEINEIGNIKVIPPDINESTDKIKTDFTDKSLVWSISSVKQVGEKAQAEIMKERSENGPYFDFDEFLDRHSQKGSAVNKSVIENLISCGAFDKLESISNVIDRIKLIKRYRTANKVKIDKEKDTFELNPDKVKFEWWHNLRQKKLCGLAFFNYSKLYLDYFKEMIGDSEYPFKDFSEIIDDPLETKSYNLTAAGYVYEIAIKTGRKGDYAIITLEQNYQFRTVVFWSNEYESFENILKNCKDTILFMNGRTNWDERNQQMAIYANENTEVLVLT